jgi:hypothetical protein
MANDLYESLAHGDWEAVAALTGAGKMHGSHGPAPSIPEMAGALRANIDAQLAASHAELVGAGMESVVASLLADVVASRAVAVAMSASRREARSALGHIGAQPCQCAAEGSGEGFPCSETGACPTEWCLPCYAKHSIGVAP